MNESEVKNILEFLMATGYVRGEVYSFMHQEELPVPTKFYTLTQNGLQQTLAMRRH